MVADYQYMQLANVNVFWFRRDLRINDNVGLFHALNEKIHVLPIFIFDTNILDKLSDRSDKRVLFIHHQLNRLKNELNKIGSDLYIYHGTPSLVFKKLVEDFQIEKVFANRDYEPLTKKRDKEIETLLQQNNIEFITYKDHVIFESLEISKEDGNPYKVYTPYKNKWKEKYLKNPIEPSPSENLVSNFIKLKSDTIPPLESLGFYHSEFLFPENKLERHILQEYDKHRNYPALMGTSRLGIHLRHGTLSIRKAVKVAMEKSEEWLNQLIWREFYIMILDNYPHVVQEEFNSRYKHVPWINNEEDFKCWSKGKTGYPIVDAGMRELNSTGYMHNRVRMIAASFLSKHLLIDWRWGEAYFAEKLLDFELANNNGGWQWAAGCGTDAQPYFRIFNPYEQARKFDPEMEYIKKWIPEINTKNYPSPIIDHKFARQRAIQTFKQSLQQ